MQAWLDAVCELAPSAPQLALELARCQELVAGYGDTRARGMDNLTAIMTAARKHESVRNVHEFVRRLREAALADEEGKALSQAISAGPTLSEEAA